MTPCYINLSPEKQWCFGYWDIGGGVATRDDANCSQMTQGVTVGNPTLFKKCVGIRWMLDETRMLSRASEWLA